MKCRIPYQLSLKIGIGQGTLEKVKHEYYRDYIEGKEVAGEEKSSYWRKTTGKDISGMQILSKSSIN